MCDLNNYSPSYQANKLDITHEKTFSNVALNDLLSSPTLMRYASSEGQKQ